MQAVSSRFAVVFTTFFVLVLGCAGSEPVLQTHPVPDDRISIPEAPPSRSSINDFADAITNQFGQPTERAFDLPRLFQMLAGKRKQAFNLDSFDDVPASSWFTHRHPYDRMSLDELVQGPNTIPGPDTSGTWTIIRAKADGVTPGFAIQDAQGNRFFIKFDPPGFSELASGAEVIATKIFHASGYFTPENYIVTFHPSILTIGDGVKLVDKKGRKRLMGKEDLRDILARVDYRPDGHIRALASRYIPGRIIGPFRYSGVVKEDPNDFVPHQHRRELRGLYVLGSWLNHIDSKAQNSLDSYVTDERGVSYVRHYLIDFGTCLGSGGRGPHPSYRGYENEIDPVAMLSKILTFGLLVKNHEKPDTVLYPSIGRFRNEGFHPARFHSIFPNPAYANMTLRDAYWGARLVASFTDEDLAAIVATGEYTDPNAETWLLAQLIERRDIICSYWFSLMPPLDNFRINQTENSVPNVQFDDLSVEMGLVEEGTTEYQITFGTTSEVGSIAHETVNERTVVLPESYVHSGAGWLTVRLRRMSDQTWSRAVHLFVAENGGEGKLAIAVLVREE